MEKISYKAVRENLDKTMEKVCVAHTPVIITRPSSTPVVMLSLEDYHALEETVLRNKKAAVDNKKLTWEATYKEMAAEQEDWSDFDITLQDGITGESFDTEKI